MTQISQIPSVSAGAPGLAVVNGRAFEDVAEAVDYTQANPSEAPFTIFLGPGEYLIERSLIINTVPVSFQGAGKGRTILTFDRTNEDATNYWIRTSTTGDPEYAPRIAFAYCDYTDQTTYGLVASASWEGRWSIRDMTVQVQYSGDRTSACAIMPVYSRPDNSNASTWDLIDIEFRTKNSPVRKPNSTPDMDAIWHDPTGLGAGVQANPHGVINIQRCEFHGMQEMTGTVSITSGLSALTGVGTAFNTELFVGSFIQIDNRTYEIATVTDDTNATIVGTASDTESGENAMAIHPWSRAISINTHELDADPLVTIRDCHFNWVLDEILYSYSNHTVVDNINVFNCTLHDVNHTTPAASEAMFVHFGAEAHFSNISVETYGYLNNVLTDGFWGVFGASGQGKSFFSNCKMINGSNTYRYRHGLWVIDQTIFASDCSFGGVYGGYLYGAYIDGTYGTESRFENCEFDSGSPNHSLYMTGAGHTSPMFTNCNFEEIVFLDTGIDQPKFIGCFFDDTVDINGDEAYLTNCHGVTGKLLNLEAPDAVVESFRGQLNADADDITVNNCDLTALTMSNPISGFRMSNSRVRGNIVIPTTAIDFHFTGCRFDSDVGSVTGAGDQWFSNCHFKSTATFRGTTILMSNCQIDGAVNLNEGNFHGTGCDFKSTITHAATHSDVILRACKFGGVISGSAVGRIYVEEHIEGEMEDHDNATALTINVANAWHAVRGLASGGFLDLMTFGAGGTGAITAVADGGGGTIDVTSAAHGLSAGDIVVLTNTTDYDGAYVINSVNVNDFNVTAVWNVTRTGTWDEPSYLAVNDNVYGAIGNFEIIVSISGSTAGTNQDFEFKVFKNATAQDKVVSRRRFAINDTGAQSLSGKVRLGENDRIWLAVMNLSSAADVTPRNINFYVHKS